MVPLRTNTMRSPATGGQTDASSCWMLITSEGVPQFVQGTGTAPAALGKMTVATAAATLITAAPTRLVRTFRLRKAPTPLVVHLRKR